MTDKELAARVLGLLAPSLREIADELEVSHDTVRAWKLGRRKPSRTNMAKLAAIAEKRSAALDTIARQIRARGEGVE